MNRFPRERYLAINGGPPEIETKDPHFVWPHLSHSTISAVNKQLIEDLSIAGSSGIFAAFEADFSAYHNREFGILFNSGTSALYAAFSSLELLPGDNVIVPDYTFFATSSPLVRFPVDIRFADCDSNGNVCLSTLSDLVDDSTKAVVVTHMWGIPCDIHPILKFCKQRNIRLIEDCSHAHGAVLRDRICGSFGDISVWSLQGQKIISGGEGGILLTDDKRLYELAVLAGHYGPRSKVEIGEIHEFSEFRTTGFGMKLRAHPLAIAIAADQFSQISDFLVMKRLYANKLVELMSSYSFVRLPEFEQAQPSWYSFTFRVNDPLMRFSVTDLHEALLAEGASEFDRPGSTRNSSVYGLYAKPMPQFGILASSSNALEQRGEAEKFYEEALKLPVWALETDEPIFDRYLATIRKVFDAFEEM